MDIGTLLVLGLGMYLYSQYNKQGSENNTVLPIQPVTNNPLPCVLPDDFVAIGNINAAIASYCASQQTSVSSVAGWDYRNLTAFAQSNGFFVTSGLRPNDTGSFHAIGKAIDVRTRDKTNAQIEQFIALARNKGITVHDERTNIFNSPKWTGAHLHLQIG